MTQDAPTTLRPFIAQLNTTLQRLPPADKGRPPERALQGFLGELATIYQQRTGKDPRFSKRHGQEYAGPLFRFILACVQPLESCKPLLTLTKSTAYPESLGDHLRRALRQRKQDNSIP